MRNFRNNFITDNVQKWILLFVVCHCFIHSNAQPVTFDPVYYNITTEHGLPSLETYSVKQDSKGYIWICTDAGVCRYDGFNFKTFTVVDGLTDNVVFDTYEDFKGRIWFLTYNSLLCYYENGKIKKYKFNHKIAEVVKEAVTTKSMLIDSNENIYYSLRDFGMYKIDRFGNSQQLQKDSFGFLTKVIEGNGIISSNLCRPKYINGVLQNMHINGHIPKKDKESRMEVITGVQSYPQKQYNLNNNYVMYNNLIYDIRDNKVVFVLDNMVTFKIIDSVFWICTLKGMIKAELMPNGMLEQKECYFKDVQFSNISVIGNDIFMTTIDQGIYVCRDFNFLKTDKSKGLIDGSIMSAVKLNNELLVSNSEKIQNIASNIITDFGIPLKSSKRIYKSKDGLVIATAYLNKRNDFSNKLKTKVHFIGYSGDVKVVQDKIYSVSGWVSEYNMTNKSTIVHYNSWDSIGNQSYIKAIEVLSNGKIIVGSINGLFEVKYKSLVPMDVGIPNLKIVSLEYNHLWGLVIGTSEKGVYIVKNGTISHFDLSSGLLADKVNTIKIYDDLIFVGTGKGLNVLKRKDKQIENVCYSTNNFYENLDVNAIYVDNDWVYLGTNTGLVKLKKSSLLKKSKQQPTNVFLEDVLVEGNYQKVTKQIIFPYDAQMLQLKFSVLQFDNWFSKKFQYRIGKNGEWIDLESPSISLFRPSGEFDVEIRYMNADFQWSLPIKLCHVNVLIPFWRQWYFWVGIATIALLWFFILNQRRLIKKQNTLIVENHILSLEQQMQHARMNPHFIFNVFNSIHSFMLQKNIDEAERYLERFSKLLREILSSSKEGTIQLHLEKSILNKYLELEQLRFKHSFEYEINLPVEIQELKIPSMLIQPFVENAVLYSDKNIQRSLIKVDISQKNSKCIEVLVINSGVLSTESLAKIESSNIEHAIGITRKRLENYNRLYAGNDFSLSVKSMDGGFIAIVLTIPIIQ